MSVRKNSSFTRNNEKSAQRDANTAHALAVVRFGHRPPVANTATHPQTGPIAIHCAAKLSVQCNKQQNKLPGEATLNT